MITRIVKIGNSQGIRIPKVLLEQSGLQSQVEIEVLENQIIIRPLSEKRQGWEQSFRKMAENKDDRLIDPESETDRNSWDKEEWEW